MDYREVVAKHGGIRPAARALGLAESTLRRWLKKLPPPPVPEYAYTPEPDELGATHIGESGVDTRPLWNRKSRKQWYICTSAQNNCEVHAGFFENLKALAASLDADILIGYTVYDRQGYRGVLRAREQKGDAGLAGIWWDRAVQPYAANARYELHRRLSFCGELDVLATAKRPLSGLDSYCSRSSIIVPHNRFEFRCVESRKGQMPKEMATTGSVTRPRFIQRKAGQVAHFHHVVGALLIEVAPDGYWYTHHLNAEEDGSFYWLDCRVSQGKVSRAPRPHISGLILGDIHREKMNVDNERSVFDVVKYAQPSTVVLHDLIDFRSRNHHTRKDPFFRIKVAKTTVQEELRAARSFLEGVVKALPDPGSKVVVAASNHHEAVERWLKEADWREDPANAELYLQLALDGVRSAGDWDAFARAMYWAEEGGAPLAGVEFLQVDESWPIEGIECGMHGHVGPSGARGNPAQFAKLGFKSFTAHTHSPAILDGCYTVGVSGDLDMEYNRGPSKWMHAHGIIYPNGKRAFLFIKDGRWYV